MVPNVLVVHADMDEQLAYDIVRVMFENQEQLVAVHAAANDLTLETAMQSQALPYHPGAMRYFEEFSDFAGVVLPARGDEGHSWHMFQVLIDFQAQGFSRPEFIKRMAERGIGIGVHYPCIPGLEYYRGRGYLASDTPVAERVQMMGSMVAVIKAVPVALFGCKRHNISRERLGLRQRQSR